jgi:hypothetical protein
VVTPAAFACHACGAEGAITLPGDGVVVVCSACGKSQPRRDYELERIRADLVRGLERAARERDLGPDKPGDLPEPTVCPACGDDLWTEEHGCPTCGHGRRRSLARNAEVFPFVVAFGVLAIGAAGAAVVGVGAKSGPWMNALSVLMSAIFSGFGVRALQRPTTLSIAPAVGTDAWGKTEYGPSRQATSEEAIRTGAIFLVVGAGLLLLGVFFGKLAG